MWETVPGVIRNNGTDSFRLEVNVNGSVSNVTLKVSEIFSTQSGQTNIVLHDDGLNGDQVAGDGIFTSELLNFNTNFDVDLAAYYEYDTNSPAGVMAYGVGSVTVNETNGAQSQFLNDAQIGILNKDIPLVQTVQLSTNLIISPHLINVLGTNLEAQKILREYTSETGEIPKKVYASLPDDFDFLIYFSTYHIEYVPSSTYGNGIAGTHQSLQVNFTGTGQSEFNNSTSYGSAGRLLGINVLDSYGRGMTSGICTHEILHQWGSYMSAFPFSDGQHYVYNSSVNSELGGNGWDDNGDGTWTLNCDYLKHNDPLDQYLMGLIETNQVTAIRVFSPTQNIYCGGIISNAMSTTTIQDIVNTYGLRTPTPATSRHDFSLGFVAESYQRLMTPVEMTYYETFAAHYTAPIPSGYPDPYVYYTWAPISRFFGNGATWSSDVLSLIQPTIRSLQLSSGGRCTITGQGLAGWSYHLELTTNLQSWVAITNATAGTNGTFTLTISSANTAERAFYRLSWP